MLPDRMRADLKEAIKARDTARVAVLRTALAAFSNAEAPQIDTPAWSDAAHGTTEVERLDLSHDDHARILRELAADRESTAGTYDANGRAPDADALRAEAALLRSYLSP